MRTLLRLALLLSMIAAGGVVLIKIMYEVSWNEAIDIADQLIEDLLV
jgi:hypothetical protein